MERLTLLFTILSAAICLAAGALWLTRLLRARKPKTKREVKAQRKAAASQASAAPAWSSDGRLVIALFALITVVVFAARLYRFWEIPYGLNQDEASIGYDAFAIVNYGYDRNGFHLPIYPIGFGDGHGPLYTFLSMPAVRLLGLSIFSVRVTNALLSCAAAAVFYFLVKRLTGSKAAALIGYGLFAVTPTLIISARWALDGCPPPSLFVVGLYLFIRAIDAQKRQTLAYGLTAAWFGLVCYSYGPAAIVVVPFLGLSCVYLLVHKKISWLQLGVSLGAFGLVIAPMAVFMLRNMLDMPAINAFISFPRFTVMRTTGVLLGGFVPSNFAEGVKRVLFQPQDLIWNTVPGFGTTYRFTWPLIVTGVGVLAWRLKTRAYSHLHLVAAYCVASFVMCGLISQNVNRISVVYPAAVLLITLAVHAVWRRRRVLCGVLCGLFAVSFVLFAHDYYGEKYKNDFGQAFFHSFGDALEYAMAKTDGTICVTEYRQNEPSVIALFYAKLPPEKFYDTVKYYDDNVEWRNAMYFDRFVFRTPEVKDARTVYVIDPDEAGGFDPAVFDREDFAYYTVMYPR